jgi:hypothetical protein
VSQFQILLALLPGNPEAGEGRAFSAEYAALRSHRWVVWENTAQLAVQQVRENADLGAGTSKEALSDR